MNQPGHKPTSAILETVKRSEDFLAELADKTIDFATESEVLENVPVISLGIKVLNVRDTFQRFRLKRNCAAFLRALGANSAEAITRFHEYLDGSDSARQEFEDTTFAILLESEKPLKAKLYGKLLSSRLKGQLSHPDFEQLSLLIHAGSIPALQAVQSFFAGSDGKPYAGSGGHHRVSQEPLLLSLGIASRFGNQFRISELGQKLYEICFDGVVSNN